MTHYPLPLVAAAFLFVACSIAGIRMPSPDEVKRLWANAIEAGKVAEKKRRRDAALIAIGQQPFFC